MVYIKWIVLLYLIVFQIYWTYVNRRTEKQTGLPTRAQSKKVRIAVMLGFATFAVVLVSLFVPTIHRLFVPISLLYSSAIPFLGGCLLFVGLVIGMVSARELGTSWRVGILED